MTQAREPDATYHSGEIAVQARAGTRALSAQVGSRMYRDHMPEQHQRFFAQLPFMIAGAVDGSGQPWASLLAGRPGFAFASSAQHLHIAAHPAGDDPLAPLLSAGSPIGLLGIEQHTRRRNRLNGVIDAVNDAGFSVRVSQSFGNCSKYIQAREVRWIEDKRGAAECRAGTGLDATARAMIAAADTFFIATAHPSARGARTDAEGVDVSNRGGLPGFVRIDDDGSLRVPDYAGNGFFNTLGNLHLNPRAGLLFVDSFSGDALHVAADAELVWDIADAEALPGALRLLRLRPRQTLLRKNTLPLRWGPVLP